MKNTVALSTAGPITDHDEEKQLRPEKGDMEWGGGWGE